MYCVGGSLKNLCHSDIWGGGLANADVIRGGGGQLNARQLLTGGRGGIKFAILILLTSYVNAPI